jgi:NAD(P)-dependent dehydrogenase (short-subunit alcohol dehydrogenase family)
MLCQAGDWAGQRSAAGLRATWLTAGPGYLRDLADLLGWGLAYAEPMSRILITGSADGLGLMAAHLLAADGHAVTLHARNQQRAADARAALPLAEAVLTGDLSAIAAMRDVADQANARGRYDAVIHNVAVGPREPQRISTTDGLAHVFAVNVLAPYLLTALMEPPARLVYLSSASHLGGNPDLADPQWASRQWDGSQAYADSKLFDVMLAFAVARRWPGTRSNAVGPGWVPTRMGTAGATDDLSLGPVTQAWLAVSDDPAAAVTGAYYYHQQAAEVHPAAHSATAQNALLQYCEQLTGTPMPGPA